MIAGFEQPTRGQVLLHGADVTGIGPDKRDVNMVFQNYALFPHLNVRDNIAFGLKRRRVARAEMTTRVRDITELVQLGGLERRMPKELSGGQQQRVALARALVNRPRALLLDEPLGALDLKLRQAMQIELKRIQRELGITFIYVTHDQSEALTMSDRLAVMRDGRIEQLGTPRQVYDEPATAFVAGFIGASNILAGRVSRVADGTAVIDVAAQERVLVPAPGPAGGRRRAGVHGAAGEDLGAPGDARPRLPPARAGQRGHLPGHVHHVRDRHRARPEILVFQQNDDSVQQLERGDEAWLSWRESHARPFTSSEHKGATS